MASFTLIVSSAAGVWYAAWMCG